MKDELGDKIMKEFTSYLTYNNNKYEEQKTQESVQKIKLKF